jgi:enoyl-CoA hydratase
LEFDKSVSATAPIGWPGRFRSGFNLAAMTASAEDVRSLVGTGGRLIARRLKHPTPLVGACSGHALAARALLAVACDERIAVAGHWTIGLNEMCIRRARLTWGWNWHVES